MGREVKRVALDFDWPLNKVYEGFLNPHEQFCKTCPFCDGSGHNAATKVIADAWYDFDGKGTKWCNDITQDEVDALVDGHRLIDFTHEWENHKWTPTGRKPTADEVNAWSRGRGMGHDAINRMICVEARATRLDVWGECVHCLGEGSIWRTNADWGNARAWEPTEPPSGPGWQMWETVSEGSPISPVCKSPESLARWLTDNDRYGVTSDATYDQWLNMIKGSGHAVSFVLSDKGLQSGIAAVSG